MFKKCPVCGYDEKPRTLPQNSYFHLICKIAGDDLGYDLIDMKEVFRRRFLEPKEVVVGDEMFLVYPSTTSLAKAQFMELIDNCIRLCAEIGIVIPDPEEYFNGV